MESIFSVKSVEFVESFASWNSVETIEPIDSIIATESKESKGPTESKESMESMSVTYDNLESHQDWGEYGNGTEENLVLDKDDERFLEDWVSSMLLNGIEDWYNNDGGFGHVLIKTYDCSYTIQNSVRIMEVENYTHAGTLSENNMLANGSSY